MLYIIAKGGKVTQNNKCPTCEYHPYCSKSKSPNCVFEQISELLADSINSLSIKKHDYRNVKIDENITITVDIEELKEKMLQEAYEVLKRGLLEEC